MPSLTVLLPYDRRQYFVLKCEKFRYYSYDGRAGLNNTTKLADLENRWFIGTGIWDLSPT